MKEISDKELQRRQKISESRKGQHVSEYVKQRASETHKGKIVSDETRQRMSEAAAARKVPVRITDTTTGKVYTFNSQREARRELGIQTCIQYIIQTKNGNYKNYYIEYLK